MKSLLAILVLFASQQSFASGCWPPELKEVQVISGVKTLYVRTETEAPVTEVFKWKNGVQVALSNVIVDSRWVQFVSPLFQTQTASPQEIEAVLHSLPEQMGVNFETRIYEVVNDMSDCVDVGTRYTRTTYRFRIEYGLQQKMEFIAITGLEESSL